MKKIYLFLMMAVMTLGFVSCSDDDPNGPTIFPTDAPARDNLDQWLLKNYTYPYNVDFQYKWQKIETDMKYNLVPADSAKAAKLAIIVKYLWFDAYNEVAGQDFIKTNVPRVITLIGSPAYENTGTMILGTAEGGYKVTLYMVNLLTDEMLKDYATLTAYYFTTMHHEFTHILNQKKPYNTDFDRISEADYVSGDWYQVADATALQKGFVRNYAMVSGTEDFAETMSQYVTCSDDVWAAKLKAAGTSGASIINQKVEMIRTYMKESWNLDIDELHKAVQHRGKEMSSLDLEHLN